MFNFFYLNKLFYFLNILDIFIDVFLKKIIPQSHY